MGKDGDPGGQATSSRDPKMQAAKVRLLDGTHKDFELPRGSDGEALFALVSADLSIEEREYFSLCFYDTEGTRHWLYNDKKILRQLKGLPWEFCFEVKFYPTAPSSLNDDHARYNLFLQLKNDVCTGRLPATMETHAALGSLVAQAEFGDAKPTAEYEQYLRTTKFAPQQSDQLIEMIAQKHKEHKGLTSGESENMYLDACKQQTMYGIFVFGAKDNKNAPVGIGICAHGIYIYKDQIRVNRFPWQGIIKIAYRKNHFIIKLKAGEIDKKEATVTYKTTDYQHAKRIWKCAVEHHTFFRLIQPDEKPKSSLFRWGSARFRYQGRTQFQTKMASQMFDKPSTVAVQRTGSARLTHSLDNVAREQAPSEQVSPLHYADNELGSREPMASPAVTYEVSGQNEKRKLEEKVGDGLPSDDDELVYTPVESPSSAAYYLSERSSAYSPNSNDFMYSQQMRSAPPYSWKTSDRDRSSSAASGRVYHSCVQSSSGSRSLPKESSAFTSSAVDHIEKQAEMEQRPMNEIVHVYHPGFYERLRQLPRQQPGRDVNAQVNGVTAVRRLDPENEMDIHPIRYFVDVHHSGASQVQQVSRIRHAGKEEVGPPILANYSFPLNHTSPLQRLELRKDLPTLNVKQYSSVYHSGSSLFTHRGLLEEEPRPLRLIARVDPTSILRAEPSSNNSVGMLPSTSRETPRHHRLNQEESSAGTKSWKVKKLDFDAVEDRIKGKETQFDKSSERAVISESSAALHPRHVSEEAKAKPGKILAAVNSSKQTFGRWRHEGDEDTVEKGQVRPETYGIASTSYDGPLESTTRSSDLEPTPLRDYARAYHSGQSWDTSKTVKTPTAHVNESERTGGKKAVLHLKTSPEKEKASPVTTEEEEAHKVRLIARVPHGTSEDETESNKPRKEQDSSGLFGFWKTGKSKHHAAPAGETAHPTTQKYVAPVDNVKRQRDIEQLPLKVTATTPYKPSAEISKPSVEVPKKATEVTETTHRHVFGRWRHEGDEETVEKGQVRPETYGITSTSYDGPLESTTRSSDLEPTPLRDYARAYHSGQSWDTSKTVKTPTAHVNESERTGGKKAVLHLKTSPEKEKASPVTTEEEEAYKVRLIARVPHGTSEDETESNKPRKEQDSSGLFGFWKTGKSKHHAAPAGETAHPTTQKYVAPVDNVKRQRDIEQLPLKVTATTPYKPSAEISKPSLEVSKKTTGVTETTHRHVFGRWRHEGDEETVEKGQVRPETYGIASTSYDGPLESTTRSSDLEPTPLRDYARAYHSGQSWDTSKTVKTPTAHVNESERTGGKKAVLHLKTSPEKEKASPVTTEEEEAHKVRLIARVPHGTSEDETESNKPRKEQDSSGLFGFWKTGKSKHHAAPAGETAHPTTQKYVAPVDNVKRQRDIEQLPLKVTATTPHKPSAEISKPSVEVPKKATEVTETTHRHVFGRWRHEGDEETVEKGQVRPETYGITSTSYDGPLESTTRSSDLEPTPLRDYARAYHSGQSWDTSKTVKTPTAHVNESERTGGKKAVLHLKTSPEKEKASPVTTEEEEAHKVRLIARVPHGTSEDETESNKPRKEQDSSGLFGFWKTGKSKHHAAPAGETAHPTTQKYVAPVDNVKRQRDIEQRPLKVTATTPYKPSAEISKPSVEVPKKATEVTETTHRHVFGRWRHEGDEETVEKGQVRPETYGITSTSYDGPLESTTRSSDLEPTPLRDYARAYHSGQSWDTSKTVKTPTAHVNESERTGGKKAVLHLKTSPEKEKASPVTTEEEEAHKVRLIARVPHGTSEDETESNKPRKEQDSSGLFGFWKTGKSKHHAAPAGETAHPTTQKYVAPVDNVKRQRDIEQLPLKVTATTPYKPSAEISKPSLEVSKKTTGVTETTHRHVFGRWRHEGDEETVEKGQVRPETYGITSTSYDGPLESTTRSSDLEPTPLRDYARAYHSGQSWDTSKTVKTPTAHVNESERTGGKKAVLHLKTSPEKEKASPVTTEEEEAHKVRLIARVPHGTSEDETESNKPRKEQDSSGLFGFWKTGKSKHHAAPAGETAHPTTQKYVAPVDNVKRQRDIEQLPLKVTATTPYKPSAEISKPSVEVPKKATEVTETTHRHVFGRWRHEGDEETVEKGQVRPETYGITSTSYDGPLESTTRSSDLEPTPLRDYARAYHSGQSWDTSKTVKTPTAHVNESERTGGKKAVLHLKTSPEKEKASPVTTEEEEAHKVRLIARVPHGTSEDETESNKPRKEQDSSGLFGFWKTGKSKHHAAPAGETAHPTTQKYVAPVDNVKRQRDIEQLPLKVTATTPYKPSAEISKPSLEVSKKTTEVTETTHRHVFGRWRHEGDEETVEKGQVRPETYGITSTSYDGPLESTTRSSDLEPTPLRDYARAYHSGQSWDTSKTVKTPTAHVNESERTGGKKAVLHLKTSPEKEKASPVTTEEEEAHKVRLIARVPHGTSEDETESKKPRKEQDSSGLFGFWKTGKSKHHAAPAGETAHPTTQKYVAPVDNVKRQRDIEQLPLKVTATTPYKPSAEISKPSLEVSKKTTEVTETTHRHVFGRWRHEGDEETVEKGQVRPETYGIASTSYDGPLESTTRSSDLEPTPLRDYARAYHSGQSWDTSKTVKTPTAHVNESERTGGKKAVLHLKTSPEKEKASPVTTEEEEAHKVRLIARVPHGTSEDETESNKPRKEQDSSGLFGFWKTGKSKHHAAPAGETAHPTTQKYVAPVDNVKRQRDIEQLPLKVTATTPYKPSAEISKPSVEVPKKATEVTETTHRHVFGRWRHEGDEETVEKGQVRPETYGITSTSYDGPLESTTRSSDLEPTPLRDYARAYHSGQSWDTSKTVKTPTAHVNESERTGGKKAVLHLKTSPEKEKASPVTTEEEEAHKVRLIARVPHGTSEDETESNKPRKEQDSSGLFGFWKTGKSKHHAAPAGETAHPTTQKYVAPVDNVKRQRDIEQLPLKVTATTPYKPSAEISKPSLEVSKKTTEVTETTHRHVFGRWRHEGDEETVEKGQVRPETYGIASTSYDGPLESTTRSSDLEPTPLRDYARAYHSGQSWDTSKTVKTPTAHVNESERTGGKKAVLHLKTSPEKEKASPVTTEEEEAHKVRLIARVPHGTSEDETESNKPRKEQDSSGLFGFWKTGKSKHHAAPAGETAHPTTQKYVAPVDNVKRQRDIEQLPLKVTATTPYKPSAEISKPSVEVPKKATEVTETTHRHVFGRWRHEGDEETVEKGQVRPETYGITSTSYDGPLESTTRSSDLEPTPLRDYARAYHSGQSWDTSKTVKTPTAHVNESERTGGKKAVLHLKTSPEKEKASPVTTEEEEAHKVRLIARVPHGTSEDETESNKPRKEQDSSGLFGFWKTGKSKHHAAPAGETAHPTTQKYVAPVDNVKRQRDIEQLPLKVTATTPHKPSAEISKPSVEVPKKATEVTETTHRHVFGRWRHEGDEETVEKGQVRPETYGIASTSYDGPLESTTRSSDLEPTPLRGYARAYHSGQSWDTSKTVKTPTVHVNESERTDGKKAVLHLRGAPMENIPIYAPLDESRNVYIASRNLPAALDYQDNKIEKVSFIPKIEHFVSADISRNKFTADANEPHEISQYQYRITSTNGKTSKSATEELSETNRYAPASYWKRTLHTGPEVSKVTSWPTNTGEQTQEHYANTSERHVASSSKKVGRTEGTMMSGDEFVEVHVDRRAEIQLEPAFCLTGAGLGAVSEDEDGLFFSVTPPMPSSDRSFFSRLLFKNSSKKSKKQKKGAKEANSSDSSSGSEDEKNQVHIVPVERGDVTLPLYAEPEDKDGKLVRRETNELKYHLKGEGVSPGFDPQNPSLASTMAEAERLNLRSPRLEHAERTVTVRALAPLPLSYEESGQPHTTISSWQESSRLPDEVTTEYDEKGNKITRTLKTSQVKHTVQKQTFQNYVVPTEGQPGVVTVEHVREETTPLSTIAVATNGSAGSPHVVETHSRSVAYEADPHQNQHEGLGEFVSCKTLTSGNRTVETYTYKTERDGIIETHVEHRVTIHSDEPIDHDAELSQAIMEATQMNPDMTVEKIEVRQESTA